MRTIASSAKGIGLRTEHISDLCQSPKLAGIDFLELSPENWMDIGGRKAEALDNIAEKYPLVAHGLGLSIGDTQPLNIEFIKRIRVFLDRYDIDVYSEHLSFSRDQQGYLYDLLPIPRHKENVHYIAEKINRVQDIIGRPLAIENITYYHTYNNEMPEQYFFDSLVKKTQCEILLDINNVYVNSQNHNYDGLSFVRDLPKKSISYYHIAGHLKQHNDFLLDTHGKTVAPEVIELGKAIFKSCGVRPLLLERDHHIPPLTELCNEANNIHSQLMI